MLRVRFAPSPTGYLHIGSARTFIFNWLYARHNGGTMILRIDDTDLERNTEESLRSIFDGLNWLGLDWDEQYRQSERLALHKQLADEISRTRPRLSRFHAARILRRRRKHTPAAHGSAIRASAKSRAKKATAAPRSGEKFVLRFRVPRDTGEAVTFHDLVYGEQSKMADDIEDFALAAQQRRSHLSSRLLRRRRRSAHQPHHSRAGSPHEHVQARPDLPRRRPSAAAVRASAAAASRPMAASFPSAATARSFPSPLIAMRDFCPQAFINFLCLLGWSPKDDREQMTRDELVQVFSLRRRQSQQRRGQFHEEDPFDPKAVWLNAEHIRTMPAAELAEQLLPVVRAAGFDVESEKMAQITPLIRERIRLLRDVLTVGDFFFVDELAPYDTAELIPKKGDAALALRVLEKAAEAWRPPSSLTTVSKRRCARRPKLSASKPARCSSPSASPCAAARPRLRCSVRSKYWAAKPASSGSTRPFRN